MEEKTKLTIGTIITIALALSGAYYVAEEDTAYVCESRDLVMLCEKLSSGLGTRCYYEDTYKTCTEGWIKLEMEYQKQEIIEESNYESKQIRCDQQECVPI